MRYAVVDATQLFNAVRDKLEGKDVSAFTRRLTETEGIVEAEEPSREARAASVDE
jgi:hypothetical protein